MLTIKNVINVAAGEKYYRKDATLPREHYYTEQGRIRDAEWWGRGAERLRLQGSIARDDFTEVLWGRLPNGVNFRTGKKMGGKSPKHRPGFDMTFSSPKSVSIAGLVFQDDDVVAAHDNAVNAALNYLQDNAVQARKTERGRTRAEHTDNILVAKFRHDTSREQDPQLHTHAVVINATERRDGRWCAVWNGRMYKQQATATMVYRTTLARELQQAGYQVTTERGHVEIAGMSKAQLDAFSSRRSQILSHLESTGEQGAGAAQRAAYATRKAKEAVDRGALVQKWQQRAYDVGLHWHDGRVVPTASAVGGAGAGAQPMEGRARSNDHRTTTQNRTNEPSPPSPMVGAAKQTKRTTKAALASSTHADPAERATPPSGTLEERNGSIDRGAAARATREPTATDAARTVAWQDLRERAERIKREVDLVSYAVSQGYAVNKRKSTRRSVVLDKDQDKIIVSRGEDGTWIYFSVRDSEDKGTIINFVLNRRTDDSRRDRGAVLEHLESWQAHAPQRAGIELKVGSPRRTPEQIQAALERMQPLESLLYLELRGIRREDVCDARFSGRLFVDERHNAVFPHYDADGKAVGFEVKRQNFKGFSPGGRKGVWMSNQRSNDNTLVLTEAVIDAISYHRLHGDENTRYLSTGGTIGAKQRDIISQAIAQMPPSSKVVLGFDRDDTGERYVAQVGDLVSAGMSTWRATPKMGNDWNDELQEKLKTHGTYGACERTDPSLVQIVRTTRCSQPAPPSCQRTTAGWAGRDKREGRAQPQATSTVTKGRPIQVDEQTSSQAARDAVRWAISHVSERSSVLGISEIRKHAMKAGLGSVLVRDVNAAINEAVKQERLLSVRPTGRRGAACNAEPTFTTPELVRAEQQFVALMRRGRGTVSAIADGDAVRTAARQQVLSRQQLRSAELVLTTSDNTVGIRGYAGVGKTRSLGVIRDVATRAGFDVRGFAPSASAALVLEKEAGIPSATLARHLITNRRTPGHTESSREMWIIDEASMASTKQMRDLLISAQAARKRGNDVRVVLVGDPRQLASIEAGAPFRTLCERGMAVAEITKIRRQDPDLLDSRLRDQGVAQPQRERQVYEAEQLREAVFDAAPRQQPNEAVTRLRRSSQAVEIQDRDERLRTVVDDYLSRDATVRSATLVLTTANKDRREINEMIREGLKQRGELGVEATRASICVPASLTRAEEKHIKSYSVGAVVRFASEQKNLGIQAGEYLTVVRVDTKSGEVTLERKDGRAGGTVTWKPGRARVEVYTVEQRGVAIGDVLRWTRGGDGRVNGDVVVVTGVRSGRVEATVVDGRGRQQTLNFSSEHHWEHAYACTVHAAQGRTNDYLIGHMPTNWRNLVGQESFYVAISRARFGVKVYTDDITRLPAEVMKSQAQKSALDAWQGRAVRGSNNAPSRVRVACGHSR